MCDSDYTENMNVQASFLNLDKIFFWNCIFKKSTDEKWILKKVATIQVP